MANALTSELNKPVDPFNMMSQLSTGDIKSRGETARKVRPELMREQSKAEEDYALGMQEAKLAQAKEGTRIEEEAARATRGAIEQFRQTMPTRPEPNITRYDQGSAARTAVLTAVVGAIAGTQSARGALRAMQGINEGARLGREDLYKSEVDRFERELAKWKDDVANAKEILAQTRDLISVDKGAALAKLKELDPMLNRGLILMDRRRQDLNKIDEHVKRAEEGINAIELEFAKATARESAKPATMPAAAKKDLEAKVGLRNTLSSLIQELDNKKYEPPVLAKFLTTQGAQDLVELSRRAPERFKDAAAFQNFMSRVERTNAPERHSLYGANLTRNELPRYNLTVPTYSDSGKTIRRILQDRLDSVNESIALKQQMYARSGQEINVAEVQPQDFVSTFAGGPPALSSQQSSTTAGNGKVLDAKTIAYYRTRANAVINEKNKDEVRKEFKALTGQDL